MQNDMRIAKLAKLRNGETLTDGGGHVVLTVESWERGRSLFQGTVKVLHFVDDNVVKRQKEELRVKVNY